MVRAKLVPFLLLFKMILFLFGGAMIPSYETCRACDCLYECGYDCYCRERFYCCVNWPCRQGPWSSGNFEEIQPIVETEPKRPAPVSLDRLPEDCAGRTFRVAGVIAGCPLTLAGNILFCLCGAKWLHPWFCCGVDGLDRVCTCFGLWTPTQEQEHALSERKRKTICEDAFQNPPVHNVQPQLQDVVIIDEATGRGITGATKPYNMRPYAT